MTHPARRFLADAKTATAATTAETQSSVSRGLLLWRLATCTTVQGPHHLHSSMWPVESSTSRCSQRFPDDEWAQLLKNQKLPQNKGEQNCQMGHRPQLLLAGGRFEGGHASLSGCSHLLALGGLLSGGALYLLAGRIRAPASAPGMPPQHVYPWPKSFASTAEGFMSPDLSSVSEGATLIHYHKLGRHPGSCALKNHQAKSRDKSPDHDFI